MANPRSVPPFLQLNSPWLGDSSGIRSARSGCRRESHANKKKKKKKMEIRAVLATPLIAATDTWGSWTVLLAAGAFGLW